MNYRQMGSTGLRVSELCLGAMTFGRESTEEDSLKILDHFIEQGGNFIDTADVYSDGISEELLGRWLKGKNRDGLVLASKVRFRTGPGTNDIGLSRKHILTGIENSLRRLGTDYLDIYQIHMWDPATPLEETLAALNSLVQAGKVRYLGASNVAGYQLQKAIDVSRAQHWEPFTCLQPLYNLLDRSIEWELLPVCRTEGVGVIPWSPLRGGWLSGKYRRGMSGPPAGTRIDDAGKEGWGERWSEYATERTWNVIDALLAVAEEVGKTPAQTALNWVLNRPLITAPIIGVRTMAHLEDNLGAAGWALSAEQMDRLNQASDVQPPYPYNF
jgi:aryl-alcohol dehydrogenase-like predicted oxidoreductase